MGDNLETLHFLTYYVTISYEFDLFPAWESDTDIVFHRGTGSGHTQ